MSLKWIIEKYRSDASIHLYQSISSLLSLNLKQIFQVVHLQCFWLVSGIAFTCTCVYVGLKLIINKLFLASLVLALAGIS